MEIILAKLEALWAREGSVRKKFLEHVYFAIQLPLNDLIERTIDCVLEAISEVDEKHVRIYKDKEGNEYLSRRDLWDYFAEIGKRGKRHWDWGNNAKKGVSNA